MGIFRHSSGNHTCPAVSLVEDAAQPFVGNTSFYHFNMILAGSCAAFSVLVIFALMFMHATHYSKPNEQAKIMRIAALIPLYSIFCILSVCFPKVFIYLNPWIALFQGIALGSFFLLLCEFVSPDPAQQDAFFAALQVSDKTGNIGAGGQRWYWLKWIMIFQYPVVSLATSVVTDITQAAKVYCLYSSKPYFAHLWLSIVQNASVVFAVLAVFKFYKALRTHLAHRKPLAKLLAFKLIVFLNFFQGIVFWALRDTNSLKANSKLTFADLNIGIPTLITCLEMVPISIFFHYAYSARPYIIGMNAAPNNQSKHGDSYHGGILGINAWLAMCNPTETLRAIALAFRMASQLRQ